MFTYSLFWSLWNCPSWSLASQATVPTSQDSFIHWEHFPNLHKLAFKYSKYFVTFIWAHTPLFQDQRRWLQSPSSYYFLLKCCWLDGCVVRVVFLQVPIGDLIIYVTYHSLPLFGFELLLPDYFFNVVILHVLLFFLESNDLCILSRFFFQPLSLTHLLHLLGLILLQYILSSLFLLHQICF